MHKRSSLANEKLYRFFGVSSRSLDLCRASQWEGGVALKRMSPKFNLVSVMALLACAALALSLVACGGSSGSSAPEQSSTPVEENAASETDSSQTESAETEVEEPEEPAVTYKLGDTVSTDLVEFTPTNIQFAIALNSSVPFGNDITIEDNHYLQPKEYNAEEDAKNPYVASKGNVIVAIEVTTNNLDRNSLDLDEFGGPHDFFTVEYDGTVYTEADKVENGYYTIPEDHRSVSGRTVANLYLGSKGPEIHRGYFELPFEPASLDDPMKVTFTLPNSDGTKTSFVFEI